MAVVHEHIFLGQDRGRSERRTWAVIALCGVMMVAEVGGGLLFGSIALVADGLHMSTHAGALLLAAIAYSYARRHMRDPRFTYGTGKLGDLAGFTSAIVLAMIAILIGYELVARLFHPVAIHFAEAIPIAGLGLLVNLASAWLLGHDDHHDHDHDHHHHHDQAHHAAHRDNNMRAAIVHVLADAAVSLLVITGLVLARTFGWLWMDPVAGLFGALVIREAGLTAWCAIPAPFFWIWCQTGGLSRGCAMHWRAMAIRLATCICGVWGRAIWVRPFPSPRGTDAIRAFIVTG